VRTLGRTDYRECFQAMQAFTAARSADTADELWLTEHAPVFTMGLKGRGREHAPIHRIPVVQSDRGGDITYHGPGQIVLYCLLDLARLNLGPRELVRRLEQAVIGLLEAEGVSAARRAGAPGVYVANSKIMSLGLRVRGRYTYHGLALNVDMDLTPFSFIDPCGYPGQPVTHCRALGVTRPVAALHAALARNLLAELGYTLGNFLPNSLETLTE
jgi:lipoyl(octanoyl) transferase